VLFVNTDEEEVTGGWYNVLVGKHEGKRQVRPRCRWKDIVKVDLREVGWMSTGLIWPRIATSCGFT
jgi:hypothetical protein